MLNRRLRRIRYGGADDTNPMEGAINIVDAMLVFACGLMLSLVTYWDVDIQGKSTVPIEAGKEVTEVQDIQDGISKSKDDDGNIYERLGTVYIDPETGKMFMTDE